MICANLLIHVLILFVLETNEKGTPTKKKITLNCRRQEEDEEDRNQLYQQENQDIQEQRPP